MLSTFVAFLCMCFAARGYAKLGEPVPQLIERFGKSYTVEQVELAKNYKFRSENVSVDAIVANGISIWETYLSDHPLSTSGEPPNDIVRGVLRTNLPKARWSEIDAAPFGADYALRSSDGRYVTVLKYTGAQPEDSVWIMTVGLAESVRALSNTPPQSVSRSAPAPAASAAPDFSPSAEQNDAETQFNTGVSYYLGQGVPKDYAKAVKWFRKAAEQNYADAQSSLAGCYSLGRGVAKNYAEAAKWYRKAAEQKFAPAQAGLAGCYENGRGVAKDYAEAVKWYHKGAEQNYHLAQFKLGDCYYNGRGVTKDYAEAAKWFRKAAEQNDPEAQFSLGMSYYNGDGVARDYVEAYKWWLLAAAQGDKDAEQFVPWLQKRITPEQIAEGQRLARNFRPREVPAAGAKFSDTAILQTWPESSGSGFFITDNGFLVTNAHVIKDAAQIRLVTSTGLIEAKVVKVDSANDLALLKSDGTFAALPVATSRTARLGSTVATVGFPNIGLQGFSPKLTRGDISSLSGPQDDARYFQISVPLQPGNSGGALVDERGNVVGIVSAALSARAALAASGALPQNVNYAVKSSFLLGFLESVPEVAAKLKEPNTKDIKFDDVVDQVKEAAVLVLVY
jgi:TPR repeat protein